MDKVITISQNGEAALSDNYANLARVNAQIKPPEVLLLAADDQAS